MRVSICHLSQLLVCAFFSNSLCFLLNHSLSASRMARARMCVCVCVRVRAHAHFTFWLRDQFVKQGVKVFVYLHPKRNQLCIQSVRTAVQDSGPQTAAAAQGRAAETTLGVWRAGSGSWRPTTVKRRQFSQSNRHSTIGTRHTEYYEALPLSANDGVRCDCVFADDGNAS